MIATTALTGATSPCLTRISLSIPAEVAGTSMETLSVSISKRLSPGATASPTDLNQIVILPSVTVSPSCGIRMSILRPQGAAYGLNDAVDAGHRAVFQNVGGRQRDVRRGDTHRRAVEVVERLIGDDRHQLRSPTAKARILFNREQAMRARDRTQHGLCVHGNQGTDVDDFAIDTVFRLEFVGGRDGARHHQSERKDGGVRARPNNFSHAQPVYDLAIGDFAFGGVKRLVFEEDDRIRIAYRSREKTDDIERSRRCNDLQARDHHAPVLDALAMLGTETRAPAVGGANHQRTFHLPVGHVTALRILVGEIVET